MFWNNFVNPLLVIVGPTAVGKTKLSIELAAELSAEIVSADSRYFYRGMDIGTAKPDRDEMKSVPHHLMNVADPDETWSLAKFQAEAQRIIAEIHNRNKLPVLVGGTGQYIQAVVQAWSMPGLERNDELRAILEQEVKNKERDHLYEFLKIADPEAAAHIDPRNVRRTLRAVEVILLTGRRFSEQRRVTSSPYSRKVIGLILDRPQLYARIDLRIEEMISRGFVDEVQKILANGYSPSLSSMTAIGYREICNYLQGDMTLEEAITLMKRNTRQYVRRQANWFKATDPQIRWFSADQVDLDQIIAYIQAEEGWQKAEIE
jgi:tRNA dimethylallyltransferase